MLIVAATDYEGMRVVPARKFSAEPAPRGTTAAASRGPVHVLLVAPFAARGGGMGRIMAYLATQGAEGVRFEMVESRGNGPAITSSWYLLRAGARIVAAASRATPSVVHLNMAERSSVLRKGLLLLLARLLGLPTLLHLHAAEIIPFYQRLHPPGRALLGMIFRAANVCVVLGEPWRAWLADGLRVAPARIVVLRNGVAVPAITHRASAADGFTFVFLGNLLARKGLPDLLRALAEPRLADKRWRLVVAGGGDAKALRRLAQSLNISARVHFAGWLDRAAADAVLAGADALVLPSHHEALPLVLLEAAGLGVPVIATPVGAIPELFRDGESALLVPPGDHVALSAALHRLLSEPECCELLSRNGRALYQREFAVASFAEGLRRLYVDLAAAKRPV
ncbi:MAG: glycosyltransferase family 4 protein [Rhodospirillales bacterium]